MRRSPPRPASRARFKRTYNEQWSWRSTTIGGRGRPREEDGRGGTVGRDQNRRETLAGREVRDIDLVGAPRLGERDAVGGWVPQRDETENQGESCHRSLHDVVLHMSGLLRERVDRYRMPKSDTRVIVGSRPQIPRLHVIWNPKNFRAGDRRPIRDSSPHVRELPHQRRRPGRVSRGPGRRRRHCRRVRARWHPRQPVAPARSRGSLPDRIRLAGRWFLAHHLPGADGRRARCC